MKPIEFDTAAWPRRDAYRLFRDFDKPYFNVCSRLDVARLKTLVGADRGIGSFALACSYIALRLANELEPFRLRLNDGKVWLHGVVDGTTTVLRPDDSFGFATLRYTPDPAVFCRDGGEALAAARDRSAAFEPRVDEQAVIHLTTLPWIHFTSFSHARNWGREDAIPKLAFGRIEPDGGRQWMPLSVEVHHALMDGLHVGRYLQHFEAALQDPAAFFGR